MKIFKLFTIIGCLIIGFSSCETYSDPEVEYSSIGLMSGEWRITITNADISPAKTVMYTYNTAEGSSGEMWLRIGTATASNSLYGVRGKVNIDLGNKTFSATNVQNAYLTTDSKFTVTDGTIVLGGATTPSGQKADAISFTLKSDRSTLEYKVTGFRRTGWPEDEK